MATASSSRQNPSRFSSLKVFKFASTSKPPPLPPKDPYYLYNPSLPSLNHSLSPESLCSQPQTPVSAQYATSLPSPASSSAHTPGPSTMSLASSSTLSPQGSVSANSSQQAGFRSGLRKLSSFGRRPKTPKSPEQDLLQPPEPADDPSISLPWNFQHNVHVDEHCNGLPPTWSLKLSDMGLSNEEITAIQARRVSSRLKQTQSIYSLNPSRDPAEGPPSVWRGLSGASTSQTSLSSTGSASRTHQRILSRGVSSTSDLPLGEADRAQQRRPIPVPTNAPTRPVPVPTQSEPTVLSSSTSSSVSIKDTAPRTPPRRAYHIANGSLSSMASPPPAYASPPRAPPTQTGGRDRSPAPLLDRKVDQSSTAPNPSAQTIPSIAVSMVPSSSAPSLSVSPPRLSLPGDGLGDLSNWSESLFSTITPTTSTAQAPTPSMTPPRPFVARSPPSGNTPSPVANRSPASTRLRAKSHSRSPPTQRSLPPQKPIPLHDLPPRTLLAAEPQDATPPPSAKSSPLWAEVMEMVRPRADGGSSSSAGGSSQSKPTPLLTSTTASTSPNTPQTPADVPQYEMLQPPLTPTGFSDEGMSGNGHAYESGDGTLRVREKENRDSDISTTTVVPAMIVSASVARSARGNYVSSPVTPGKSEDAQKQAALLVTTTRATVETVEDSPRRSPSPVSLVSSSESSVSTTAFGSGSTSGSAYAKSSPAPSPRAATFVSAEQEQEKAVEELGSGIPTLNLEFDTDMSLDALRRPSLLIDDIIATGALSDGPLISSPAQPSPITPASRYPGWVTDVVAHLSEFIDQALDPRALFGDLREIGEGESGSVYAARVLSSGRSRSSAEIAKDEVAIKNVPLLPNGSPKLVDLQRELTLMRGVRHPNVLTMEEVFVDVVEDALWLKMELMERSLADVLILTEEGIVVEERPIALFAGDVLRGLSYLQGLGIAHRDLRSDNLLVNSAGVTKIADFSSAVQVSREEPSRTDVVGVIYWQAPEMRTGPYNALKVDVWSLGATVWELAQSQPPFLDAEDPQLIGDRWPPLHQPDIYSRSFHDFLSLCSQPSSSRPDPDDLLETPFIRNASGRPAILELLSECRSIEVRLSRQSMGSNGTV